MIVLFNTMLKNIIVSITYNSVIDVSEFEHYEDGALNLEINDKLFIIYEL